MKRILWLSLLILLPLDVHSALPGDSAAGKRLHDAGCTGCHGSEVYVRENRLVRSLPALEHQLARCNHMLKNSLTPEEKQNIIRYLNDSYYRLDHGAGKAVEIRARYDAAWRIRSGLERDSRYAALVSQAAHGHDFELAIEIAGSLSSAALRDRTYANIVHQAVLARSFPAADKAARKMSSPALREEQLKKIVGACPPNTMTGR